MTRTELTEWWAEAYPDDAVVLLEPEHFDAALVGVIERGGKPLAVYDVRLLREPARLDFPDGISDDELDDHIYYNIVGSEHPEHGPTFLYRPPRAGEDDALDLGMSDGTTPA